MDYWKKKKIASIQPVVDWIEADLNVSLWSIVRKEFMRTKWYLYKSIYINYFVKRLLHELWIF